MSHLRGGEGAPPGAESEGPCRLTTTPPAALGEYSRRVDGLANWQPRALTGRAARRASR